MDLEAIKAREWFYEFELPDGSRTRTNIPPEVRPVHRTRLDALRRVIAEHVPEAASLTAADLASHEGFFSVELARHFRAVRGIDIRPESLAAAQAMAAALGVSNVTFELGDLQQMAFEPRLEADFVLLYGLLYHLENPIHTLRLAARMARRHLLVETQVFPHDVSGRIEDGHYAWQRAVEGVFSLSVDYPQGREGGSTDLALVPSLNALTFLLRNFGFARVEVLAHGPEAYERFRRRARAIIFASR